MKRLFGCCLMVMSVSVAVLLSQNIKVEVNQDLRDKIGEMLIVGFHENQFNRDSLIAQNISTYHVGGVIIFADKEVEEGKWEIRNVISPEQLRTLIAQIKEYSIQYRKRAEGELFVGIDQEGGWVNPLPKERGFLQEDMSAKELGKINCSDYTYSYASRLAEYLQDLGVNLNFAPVVDVAVNENNFIYERERCFSNNPSLVFKQAKAFVKGMHGWGLVTSLKHFPGHGSSNGDTHRGMVDVTATWGDRELEPYKQFIDEDYDDMIMISHVINKDLDPSAVPATFSEKMVTKLLREEMGFQGVIVSDDLCMGAIANEYSFEDTLKSTINAGINMLILANHRKDQTKEAVDIIEKLVACGEIDDKKIEESYNRIINLKLKRSRK